jgi:hypothetical protein
VRVYPRTRSAYGGRWPVGRCTSSATPGALLVEVADGEHCLVFTEPSRYPAGSGAIMRPSPTGSSFSSSQSSASPATRLTLRNVYATLSRMRSRTTSASATRGCGRSTRTDCSQTGARRPLLSARPGLQGGRCNGSQPTHERVAGRLRPGPSVGVCATPCVSLRAPHGHPGLQPPAP